MKYSGTRRKSCSVRLCKGLIEAVSAVTYGDLRYFCLTRKESAETTFYKHKCSCLVNELRHSINALLTCLLSCLNNSDFLLLVNDR